MATAVLECVITTEGGKEVKKTAEVTGEGKGYLACLSESLCRMQPEVNAYLTQLVESERRLRTNDTNNELSEPSLPRDSDVEDEDGAS